MGDQIELRIDGYQENDLHQEMRPKVSARLIAASSMLELSGMELQATIDRELIENPALEADEVSACEVCGTPLQGTICPTCLRLQRAELPADWDTIPDVGVVADGGDDDFDPVAAAAGVDSLSERLLRELGAIVPRDDRRIAEQLVWNLDERGYLDVSLEEVADTLGVDLARVEAVLSLLQTLEPAGVGARDLRECLLVQISVLKAQGIEDRLAARVVEAYLTELGQHRFDRIARELRVHPSEVAEAADFIREHLNPFPAHGHAGAEAVAEARALYKRPDVAILLVDGAFVVETIEARRLDLRVSEVYATAAKSDLPAADRAHVGQFLTRARLFIQNVAQRRQTIKTITEAIVRAQSEFLRQGVRALKPLTRSQVADSIGLDESTVSRATNGKHVLLPSGEVVSFDTFFSPQLAVHAVIQEILAAEQRAMTDAEIMRALHARGIQIARRTVAKYRGQIGVLPSGLRDRRSVGRAA